MTNNERDLLAIIRNHRDPEQALITAIEIILEFLKQDESFGEQSSVSPRESA